MHSQLLHPTAQPRIEDLQRYADQHRLAADTARRRSLQLGGLRSMRVIKLRLSRPAQLGAAG